MSLQKEISKEEKILDALYEKLVEEHNSITNVHPSAFSSAFIEGWNSCMNDVRLIRNELLKDSSLRLQEKQQGWVSVEERLPEYLDRVLVWMNTSLRPQYAAFLQKDNWLVYDQDGSFHTKTEPEIQVLFWQPLPSNPLEPVK
jgi:hypothetical protein